jgi:hypothetical protein
MEARSVSCRRKSAVRGSSPDTCVCNYEADGVERLCDGRLLEGGLQVDAPVATLGPSTLARENPPYQSRQSSSSPEDGMS